MIHIRRFTILFCAILLAAHLAPVSFAQHSTAQPQGSWDGYIVKLSDEMPRISTFGLTDAAPSGSDILVVDTLEQAARIPAEYVEYIEPNYLIELFSEEEPASPFPSDPYYTDYQWNLQQIGALSAYQQGLTGDGVRIGFVDSGINAAHEDLDSNRISGANFNSDGLNYDEDNYGHGTFAAGLVAAQTDNGLGLAGIAPKAEIKAYRVFSNKTTTTSAVVNAIDQAIADGCRILNLSLGTPSSSVTLSSAIDRAAEAGIILVAAVGNNGTSTLQYPAAYTSVIGVGSVDDGSAVSSFSQRNSSVYVTAPGGGVASLDHTSANGYSLNLSAASNRGTSFSAPVVTGMAALALGYDSDITEEGFRSLLKNTSTDLGDSGYDTSYGYGEVNVTAFLEELTREYTIGFELSGGSFPETVPASYRVTDDTFTLPTPVREGYVFLGWYASDDLSGLGVTQIPAGSIGDKQFYAAWQEERTVTFDSLSAKGYRAKLTGDNTYQVKLPAVTTMTADDIQVTGLYEGAAVSTPTVSDDGTTWTFSVTYGPLTRQYILQVTRTPTPEMGVEVMDAIQVTVDEAQLVLDVVPEDMTVVVAGYRNGKLLFLQASTRAEVTIRTFPLPAGVTYDSLRLFPLFDWMPIAPDRQLKPASEEPPSN